MTSTLNAALAEAWRKLRNGDLTQLDAIIAEDFVVHAALMGGTSGSALEGAGRRSAGGSAVCTP